MFKAVGKTKSQHGLAVSGDVCVNWRIYFSPVCSASSCFSSTFFFFFYSLAPSDYKTPLTHPPTQETPHHLCCIFFHKKCMFSIEAEPREAKKILLQKHRTCSLSSNMSLLVVQMKNGWSSCTLVAAVVPYTSMNSLQKCMEAGD